MATIYEKKTTYLMELKNNIGTKIIFTQKKTGFFGMISNMYSLNFDWLIGCLKICHNIWNIWYK